MFLNLFAKVQKHIWIVVCLAFICQSQKIAKYIFFWICIMLINCELKCQNVHTHNTSCDCKNAWHYRIKSEIFKSLIKNQNFNVRGILNFENTKLWIKFSEFWLSAKVFPTQILFVPFLSNTLYIQVQIEQRFKT